MHKPCVVFYVFTLGTQFFNLCHMVTLFPIEFAFTVYLIKKVLAEGLYFTVYDIFFIPFLQCFIVTVVHSKWILITYKAFTKYIQSSIVISSVGDWS